MPDDTYRMRYHEYSRSSATGDGFVALPANFRGTHVRKTRAGETIYEVGNID